MTREQARQVLLAYRPGAADAADPEVTAALDLAKRDSELDSWLQQQLDFHNTVSAELRQIPVPRGLKEKILADKPRVIVPLWRRPEFLLAAACLVLGLVLSGLWFKRPSAELSYAGFRARMITAALRVYRMDIVTNNPAAVREFLASHGAPADYSLTAGLAATPVIGGAKLTWQGNPVSMVCFQLPRRQTLFMFVLDESALKEGTRPGALPKIAPSNGVSTASWSRDGKVYFIAAPTDPSELKKYLENSI